MGQGNRQRNNGLYTTKEKQLFAVANEVCGYSLLSEAPL